jgi:hypothetical protein
MLRTLFSILFVFISLSVVYSGTIVIEGKYQNKNLYIQNSYAENGVGFCAYEVVINGQVSTDEINSKTFEIDFSALPIEQGTHVVVEIKHKNDCAPKVLNPEALKSEPTFEVVDIKLDKKGLLIWSTINEAESLPYLVEQFRWNKWVKVGEVKGLAKKGTNNYMFQSVLHSGENKFRVKQVGFGGIDKKSQPVTLKSDVKRLDYKMDSEKSVVTFSDQTLFEVYDLYGNVIKYGYGGLVNISNLPKGSYFLCYDNVVADFTK